MSEGLGLPETIAEGVTMRFDPASTEESPPHRIDPEWADMEPGYYWVLLSVGEEPAPCRWDGQDWWTAGWDLSVNRDVVRVGTKLQSPREGP